MSFLIVSRIPIYTFFIPINLFANTMYTFYNLCVLNVFNVGHPSRGLILQKVGTRLSKRTPPPPGNNLSMAASYKHFHHYTLGGFNVSNLMRIK